MRHWVGKFLGLDVFVDYHDNKINFYIEGITYLDKDEVKKLFEEYAKSVIRVDTSKIEDTIMYTPSGGKSGNSKGNETKRRRIFANKKKSYRRWNGFLRLWKLYY